MPVSRSDTVLAFETAGALHPLHAMPPASVEYATLDFGADSHPYGSAYWMLTGLHSAHVASGLAAMMLLFVRSARGAPRSTTSSWTVGVSLFWHLVDVIVVIAHIDDHCTRGQSSRR